MSAKGHRGQPERPNGPDCGGIRFHPDRHRIREGSGQLGRKYATGKMPEAVHTENPTTSDEAQVIWSCALGDINPDELAKDAAVVRRAAVLAGGFRCVVIRARAHNTTYQRDKEGKLVTISTAFTTSGAKQPKMAPSDWHLTVAMGDSFDKLHIQGHVFVYPYRQNHPREGELLETEPEDLRQDFENDLEKAQPFKFWTMRGVTIEHKSDGQPVMPEPRVQASGY